MHNILSDIYKACLQICPHKTVILHLYYTEMCASGPGVSLLGVTCL